LRTFEQFDDISNRFKYCTENRGHTLLQLIDHIVRTSSRRDRTEINVAVLEAMEDLFHPLSLTIYRAFLGTERTMVFACAGVSKAGRYVRNAYLPETDYCQPIDFDPLLQRSQSENAAVLERQADGHCRLIFPVAPVERLLYMIDITIADDLTPQQRIVLMGFVEYFSNHIALLDYGETDTLTGLPNRKTFDKHLFEVLGQASADQNQSLQSNTPHRRKGGDNGRHWLAVCDIDHFKSVNDTHGHLIGDEVLVMFASLMRNTFRFQDQLFRFGGEEFIAVIQPTTEANVLRAFERFRQMVENHVFSRVGRITVSIGYSQLSPNDTPSDVIDRADDALYYIKQNGRNNVGCYEQLISSGKLASKASHTGEIELF
jgi:diguanylate cyclase (GGDEF)-like protein